MKGKILFSFLSLLLIINALAQDGNLSGRVIDQTTSTPLQGVTVLLEGTKTTTQTDADGRFTIRIAGVSNPRISLTYIGFKPITVNATADAVSSIMMEPTNASLTDVVVVGYGTVKKRDLTGSVVSVKNEELVKVPAGNAMEALQGKLPGVDITRTSGGAGASSNVTVRGNRSILANNNPLYIVDGIQYPNFQDINPADIASMEVLKDASSTAIYGSRGANGVIIITTKKGVSGKPKVSFNAYYGVTEAAGYPKPMTGPQYAELRRQAFRTIGQWNSPSDDLVAFFNRADVVDAVNRGVNTYWAGEVMDKGAQQDYNISVTAGSDKTRVFLSYGFFREDGLLPNDYSNRHSVRLNVEQSLRSNLKAGLQSQFTYYDQNLRNDGILNHSNKVLPFFTPYDDNGDLVDFPGSANQFNPLFNNLPDQVINDNQINRLLTTAYIDWRIIPSLTFRSNFGVTNGSSRNGYFTHEKTIERSTATGSLSRINNNINTQILWENILTWQEKFGQHNIGVTGLTSFIKNTSENSSSQATGQLLPSQLFYALQNNPSNIAITSNFVRSTLVSGAFRINYNYAGKYLLTLTGRSDGSSVLAEGKKWAFFPSAAAAWRISDEGFMNSSNTISDLKLRVSYGVAGNSAVRPYATQSGLILVPYSYNDVQALAYALDATTGNTDLGWELTGTANIGIDFGFLNQRIFGSIDYYDSKTKDLLLERSLPASSGVSKVTQNVGRTRNRGVEIGLHTVNVSKPNFKWSSGITFTKNKEEIVELVGKQDDIANGWFIGYPVNSFYNFNKIGIWQSNEADEAAVYGRKPGEIKVQDVNGDKVHNSADDRMVLGSAVPDFIVGFTNDFEFHGFDLNIYAFARQGQMFVSDFANKFEPNGIENSANVNYWTPENPTNEYPRPNANISRASMPFASTLGYKDGSFVKIRNITLGYTLPGNAFGNSGISKLRFYVSARNYFVWSKVNDYDPEGEGSFERPLTKLLMGGLTLDF